MVAFAADPTAAPDITFTVVACGTALVNVTTGAAPPQTLPLNDTAFTTAYREVLAEK